MNEERLIILRMLEEGKLTALEAAELLDALSEQEEAAGTPGVEEKSFAPAAPEQAPQPPSAVSEGQGSRHADIAERIERVRASRLEREARVRARRMEGEARRSGRKGGEMSAHFVRLGEELGKKAGQMGEEMGEKFGRLGEEVGEQAGKLGERLGEEIGEKMSKMGESFLSLDKLLDVASWFGGGVGARQEVAEEFTGEFAAGTDLLTVGLHSRNGSLMVEPWDEDGYKVVAVKKVVAATEEEARQVSAGVVQVTATGSRLEVQAQENQRVPAVNLRVYVPRHRRYHLELHTTNGAIRAERLQLGTGSFHTTNGSVTGNELHGDELTVHSTNGAISFKTSGAKTVQASTTNGSIRWQGAAGQMQLTTTNGSVRVQPATLAEGAADQAGAGYKVTTCNGSIHVDLSNGAATLPVQFQAQTSHGRIHAEGAWEITQERKSPGSWELAGRTAGSVGASAVIDLQLRTSNGSIHLSR